VLVMKLDKGELGTGSVQCIPTTGSIVSVPPLIGDPRFWGPLFL